jgi:hypothetical protein
VTEPTIDVPLTSAELLLLRQRINVQAYDGFGPISFGAENSELDAKLYRAQRDIMDGQ